MKLLGLVIAGGQSTRMGQDKALMTYNARTWVEQTYLLLQPHVADIFVSAPGALIYDTKHLTDDDTDIGPAAALLRAHREQPGAHWLVMAVDFPLATDESVAELICAHEGCEITCYAHADGTPEPLFAIWSPEALQKLLGNVAAGRVGPMATLQQCRVTAVPARNNRWLKNVNTPEQWLEAQQTLL